MATTSRFMNEIRELFRNEMNSSRIVNDHDILNLNNLIVSYNENMRMYNQHMMSMVEIYMLLMRSGQNANVGGRNPSTGRSRRSGVYNHGMSNIGQQNLGSVPSRTTNTRSPYRHLYRNWTTPMGNTYTNFFENVIVRPTAEQIQCAMEEITFSNGQSQVINNTCPITLEDFAEGDRICRIKHCGHAFKYRELSRWFNMNVHCPVCRYDIRDYVAQTDISNNNPVDGTNTNHLYQHPDRNDDDDREYDDLPDLISFSNESINENENENGESGILNRENAATIANSVSNLIQNYLTNLSNDYTEYTMTFDIPTFMMDLSFNPVD